MKNYIKEIVISILILFLFYLVIKKNNVIILNPSKDQMKNVSYYSDDINDIDNSWKNQIEKDNEN